MLGTPLSKCLYAVIIAAFAVGCSSQPKPTANNTSTLNTPQPVASTTTDPLGQQNPTSPAAVINTTHTYSDGTHAYEGVLTTPTPCHQLQTQAIVRESFPEQVVIEFTVKPSNVMCIQVLAEQPFKVTFSASERARVTATFNGQSAELKVTEK